MQNKIHIVSGEDRFDELDICRFTRIRKKSKREAKTSTENIIRRNNYLGCFVRIIYEVILWNLILHCLFKICYGCLLMGTVDSTPVVHPSAPTSKTCIF